MTVSAFPIAPVPGPLALEAGRKLFAGRAEFLKGAVAMPGLPPDDRAEVCFAGRSNAGKSTLINALTGRGGLARASNAPGRTQEINYFTLGSSHYLVDLPGYGYARAPLAAIDRWRRLMNAYLAGRQSLRRAFVLIDSRHGAKASDDEIMSFLDKAAVGFQAVMTKADKAKSNERDKALEITRAALARHPTAHPELIVTSSVKGGGLETLRAAIAAII